jgi:hypothetical protein
MEHIMGTYYVSTTTVSSIKVMNREQLFCWNPLRLNAIKVRNNLSPLRSRTPTGVRTEND